jgi:hypothetical protein
MPEERMDEDAFTARFRARAIVVGEVQAGQARDLAAAVVTTRSDGAVHTGVERRALFGRLAQAFAGGDTTVTLTDAAGDRTPAGQAVDAYDAATTWAAARSTSR